MDQTEERGRMDSALLNRIGGNINDTVARVCYVFGILLVVLTFCAITFGVINLLIACLSAIGNLI